MLLRDATTGWLLAKRSETYGSTPNTCAARIQVFLRFSETPEDIEDTSPSTIRQFIVWLQGQTNPRTGKPLSPIYINTLFGTVRDLFRWCQREGILQRDVFQHIKAPKKPKMHKDVFTSPELKAVFAACQSERDRLILMTLLDTSMRRHELCSVTIGDCDFEACTIQLCKTKSGDERVAFMSARLASLLWKHCAKRLKTPDGPLFESRGHSITIWTIANLCYLVTKRTGIHVNAHKFRHTAITRLFEAGLSMEVVRSISGHRSYAVLKDYAHLSNKSVASALNAVSLLKS